MEAALLGLDCASFLSPASDLAHLVLTSGPPSLARAEWEEIVAEYYSLLSSTLARFGLVLRHLGTSLAHFKAEVISTQNYSYLLISTHILTTHIYISTQVSRALAGQYLVVILVLPILAMFGPRELARLRAQGHRRNSVGKNKSNSGPQK